MRHRTQDEGHERKTECGDRRVRRIYPRSGEKENFQSCGCGDGRGGVCGGGVRLRAEVLRRVGSQCRGRGLCHRLCPRARGRFDARYAHGARKHRLYERRLQGAGVVVFRNARHDGRFHHEAVGEHLQTVFGRRAHRGGYHVERDGQSGAAVLLYGRRGDVALRVHLRRFEL